MGGEKSAAATTGNPANPGKRVEQRFLGVSGAAEDIDSMTIGGEFLAAAITSGYKFSGDRRQGASCGKKLLQASGKNIEAGAEHLRFRDVAQILVGQLVRQNAAQLIIIGTAQKPHGNVELAVARVGGIDLILVDDAHPHLVNATWMIHRLEKRYHHSAQAFEVSRVDAPRCGRGRR
jgi:hypothetical protein